MVRRFQKIDVNEPTVEDAIKIFHGLKPYYEEFHKLRYTNDAIRAAVELSARYIHDRKLPDKAIDVIDETGASQMLPPHTSARGSSASRKSRPLWPPWRAFRRKPCPRTTRKCCRTWTTTLKPRRLWPGYGDRGAHLRD